jgi:hypothetical protein
VPDFQVLEIKGQEPWSNDKGQFIGYLLTVRNAEGREIEAKINKKTTSAPPAVGDTIDANLQPSSNPHFPPLLKANFNQGGKGRSPEDTRAMSRSAAQDRALAYMQVKATMGALKEFRPTDLVPLIEWFQADVNQYAQGEQPKTVHGLPVRNEPERTGAPDVQVEPYAAPAPPDGSEPFAA